MQGQALHPNNFHNYALIKDFWWSKGLNLIICFEHIIFFEKIFCNKKHWNLLTKYIRLFFVNYLWISFSLDYWLHPQFFRNNGIVCIHMFVENYYTICL
jgi:hypothetical protein